MDLDVSARTEWASEVATRWIDRLTHQPTLTMCLPTGHSPRPVYRQMAEAVDSGRVSFGRATVFLLDEFGGLEADDPARCDSMLRRDLLDHVDLPPASYHRPEIDAPDPMAEAGRYASVVGAAGLDLTLVGLGQNGHIGLNEPGATDRSPARRVDLEESTSRAVTGYGSRSTPTWGVTLGLADLLASREIWILVRGSGKAEITRSVVHAPIGPEIPATYLRTHPNCVLFADNEAAASV